MIGGNTIALIQVKDEGAKNAIGERIHQWADVASATGWLDLVSGDSKYTPHSAKVQEYTPVAFGIKMCGNFIYRSADFHFEIAIAEAGRKLNGGIVLLQSILH